jgi:hypothetical protein
MSRAEHARKNHTTHGHTVGASQTRIFMIWSAMKDRCLNPSSPRFADYGGRGIEVCARWMSFAMFLSDMGQPPSGLTLERKNTNGNYEPSNCRWATRYEQANNTRKNIYVKHDGEVSTLSQFCRAHSLAYGTIWYQIKHGRRVVGGKKIEIAEPYKERES